MRKEADFEVMDNIVFGYGENPKITDFVTRNVDMIKDETLTNEVVEGTFEGYTKEWKVNGEVVTFSVRKA